MKISKQGYDIYIKLSDEDRLLVMYCLLTNTTLPDKFLNIVHPGTIEHRGEVFKVVEVSFIDNYIILSGDVLSSIKHIKNQFFKDGFILSKIKIRNSKKYIFNKYKYGKRYIQCYRNLSNTQPICTN